MKRSEQQNFYDDMAFGDLSSSGNSQAALRNGRLFGLILFNET